jgi:branched-chain amino acid transport system substrate-binding protein
MRLAGLGAPSQVLPPAESAPTPIEPGAGPLPGAPVDSEALSSPGRAATLSGIEGKTVVALLLPLSGPNAPLGRAMLDAAQMALFDVADDRFALVPRDTQGTPAGAARAANQAIAQGAKLILGPLLMPEVEAVKPVARAANVNVVAFSTAVQLAGDGVYLMSFLPKQQVDRIAAVAHDKGASRFAALAPSTPYGQLVVDELRAATAAMGASVDRVEFYDPAARDPSGAVRRLAGHGPTRAARGQPQPAAATASAPDAPFDALLLPEGGGRLKEMAALLPYFDIDTEKVRLLGTGVWDEPGLGTEPAIVGGWFAAPPPEARADFERRFQGLYKRRPPRLATLGYDAAALAALLARSDGSGFSPTVIESPSGFSGVDGIFRFGPDGLVQRGLAVLQVTKTGTSIVVPAPETFEELGY